MTPDPLAAKCPYPGLRAFFTDEREWYFGREAHVDAMLTCLERQRFLAVVGSSGSGKSSLVFAGLIPALREGNLIGSRRTAEGEVAPWHIITFHPGNAPLAELAAGILRAAPRKDEPHIAGRIRAALDAGDLRAALDIAGCVDAASEVLVYADQFEELFRFGEKASRTERENALRFANLFVAAAKQDGARLHVLLSMRSEFIGHCEQYPGLPELVSRSQFLTPRLSRTELERSLRCPAESAGWSIKGDALNVILNDCGSVPDELPLAQHVLRRMWHRVLAEGRTTMTLADYTAVGGLGGSLAMHGREVLAKLPKPDGERAARVLFMALCDQREDGPLVRRLTTREEVAGIAGRCAGVVPEVIAAFANDDPGFIREEDGWLDIRHEAVLRRWDAITAWRFKEGKSVTWLRELAEAAKDEAVGQGELWRGKDLAGARQWLREEEPGIAWAHRYDEPWTPCANFIEESIAAEDAAARDARVRRRTGLIFLAMVVVAAFVAAVFFAVLNQQLKAQKLAADTAAENANKAKKQAMDAEDLTLRGLAYFLKLAEPEVLKALEGAGEAERNLRDLPTDANALAFENALQGVENRIEVLLHPGDPRKRKREGIFSDAALEKMPVEPFKAVEQTVLDAERRLSALKASNAASDYFTQTLKFRMDALEADVATARKAVEAIVDGRTDAQIEVARAAVLRVGASDMGIGGTRALPKPAPLERYLELKRSPEITTRLDEARRAFWQLRGELDARLKKTTSTGPVVTNIPRVPLVSADKAIRLPDTKAPTKAVRWVEFAPATSPLGTLLATAGDDRKVFIWDRAGSLVREMDGSTDAVNAVEFSPSLPILASASNGSTVRLYDLAPPRYDEQAQMKQDGLPGRVRAWAFEGHSDSVTSLDFDQTGAYVASASADRTVRVFEASGLRPIYISSPPLPKIATFVRFNHATDAAGQVVVSSCDDGIVRLHHIARRKVRPLGEDLGAPVRRASFHPGDKWIVACAYRSAFVWSYPDAKIWEPTGKSDGAAYRVEHPDAVRYVAFRPGTDDPVIVTCCANGEVRVMDARLKKAADALTPAHEDAVRFADWSADGRWLATCGDDGATILWDCADKPKAVVKFTGHKSSDGAVPATMVRISPDATHLVTACEDGMALLHDISQYTGRKMK